MSVRFRGAVALCLLAACSGDAPPRRTDPNKLSSRGLYSNIDQRRVVKEAFEYTPDYALWSDGADKRRWLILPKGERVEIGELAHWDFPLGTKLFKEFSRDGVLLETRLIERIKTTGRIKEDFFMGTFVWDEAQRDATLELNGRDNVNGTEHDVPAQKYCIVCHRGEPGGILGFSAVQLSASGTLHRAFERGLLSSEPERSYEVPGDDVQRPALGTLHANCGHCHAEGATADFMHLRILPEEVERPIEELDLYTSTVGTMLSDEWEDHPSRFTTRIVPGDPEQSSILYRMQQRGDDELVPDQMPPLATREVDEAAVAAVRAWITSLPAAPEETPDAGAAEPTDAGVAETDGSVTDPNAAEQRPMPTMDAGVSPPTQADDVGANGQMNPRAPASEMDAAVSGAGSTEPSAGASAQGGSSGMGGATTGLPPSAGSVSSGGSGATTGMPPSPGTVSSGGNGGEDGATAGTGPTPAAGSGADGAPPTPAAGSGATAGTSGESGGSAGVATLPGSAAGSSGAAGSADAGVPSDADAGSLFDAGSGGRDAFDTDADSDENADEEMDEDTDEASEP